MGLRTSVATAGMGRSWRYANSTLYLDEPAPFADRLGIDSGEPSLVVMCRRCTPRGALFHVWLHALFEAAIGGQSWPWCSSALIR